MQTKEVIRWIGTELATELGDGEAWAIARLLMEAIFPNTSWTQIQFRSEPLSKSKVDQVSAWLDEIKQGRPVQYVLGHTWFDRLKLQVTPDVLIPRPETEELVQWVSKWLEEHTPKQDPYSLVDFGTGSGCIALALKNRHPEVTVYGLDQSRKALEVARANAERLGIAMHWLEADLLDESVAEVIPSAQVWVSNPPYVLGSEAATLQRQVGGHEPAEALFVTDNDPLVFYRRLSELASRHADPPEALFAELHPQYAEEVVYLWKQVGWHDVVVINDMQGKKRMAGAFRKSPPS